jgi:predicted RNA binding protein YcfA (HicA-like mRNA interferase family)
MKVRDIIRRLSDDGWTQTSQKGSHRHFTHLTKPGKVTVNGHPGDDITGDLLRSIFRQAQLDWNSR